MTIKTIDATVLRNNLSDAMDAVTSGQALIVKKRGKDRVVMIDIDAYEDYLAAQAPGYLKSIAEARAESGALTPEEVFGELWEQ